MWISRWEEEALSFPGVVRLCPLCLQSAEGTAELDCGPVMSGRSSL